MVSGNIMVSRLNIDTFHLISCQCLDLTLISSFRPDTHFFISSLLAEYPLQCLVDQSPLRRLLAFGRLAVQLLLELLL
jgi:hypothetical protein